MLHRHPGLLIGPLAFPFLFVGVSIAALARNGVDNALTTEQINQLLEEKPPWLATERESYQEVLREQRRLKALHADQAREKRA